MDFDADRRGLLSAFGDPAFWAVAVMRGAAARKRKAADARAALSSRIRDAQVGEVGIHRYRLLLGSQSQWPENFSKRLRLRLRFPFHKQTGRTTAE